nr:hypothetical protein [Veillonella sp.]
LHVRAYELAPGDRDARAIAAGSYVLKGSDRLSTKAVSNYHFKKALNLDKREKGVTMLLR